MSLLLSQGHADAADYPLGMVWDETGLAIERMNGNLASLGVIVQSAGGALLSKDGFKNFKALLKQIGGE